MIPELTASELAARLKSPEPPLLIDVRETNEWQYCRIPGAQLKPMSLIMTWIDELDKSTEMVFYCHSGVRSYQVAAYLQQNGFQKVINLRGGIDAWSVEVDPSVRRY